MPYLPPRAMVMSRPGLLSGFVVLPQLRFVLVSMAPVTTKDVEDRTAQS